jgi:hypothetical protein
VACAGEFKALQKEAEWMGERERLEDCRASMNGELVGRDVERGEVGCEQKEGQTVPCHCCHYYPRE